MFEERIVSARELRRIIPYHPVHIGRLEKAGRFPRRIKLGPNRVGWRLSEILAWIDARTAERDAQAA